MIEIGPLRPGDRSRWSELWGKYLDFYEVSLPTTVFEHTWTRLIEGREIKGLVARGGADIVGITHFLYHSSAWTMQPVVYLQDLFTDEAYRGRGVARALIEAVAAEALASGSNRLYWLTQSDNATARLLYDRLAKHTGFIRYEYPLS